MKFGKKKLLSISNQLNGILKDETVSDISFSGVMSSAKVRGHEELLLLNKRQFKQIKETLKQEAA